MKRIVTIVLLAAIFMAQAVILHAGSFAPIYVYSNKRAESNNYAPSGWMGDTKDVFYSDGWPKETYKGPTCIKVSYKPTSSSREKWAGIYWQDPPNNWGSKKSTNSLTGATKLVFAIRGDKGGEVINDIFVGGIKGKYRDSCSIAIGPIELTNEWEEYEVSLEGEDLSHVIGGFGWSTNTASNPSGCIFYLDEIRYE